MAFALSRLENKRKAAQYRSTSLERTYSIKNAADAAGFYNDLALDSLSRENPSISFQHAAPGFV
jgi:hypothetical protein